MRRLQMVAWAMPLLLAPGLSSPLCVQVAAPGPGTTPTLTRDFAFHACLGPETTQEEVCRS